MSKIEFRDLVGSSNTTLAMLGKNEPVSLEIIDKICTKLECSIQDVVEITNQISMRSGENSHCAFISVRRNIQVVLTSFQITQELFHIQILHIVDA